MLFKKKDSKEVGEGARDLKAKDAFVDSLFSWKVKVTQSMEFSSNYFTIQSMELLSLLQGIFPTQGLKPGLLHCRQILYYLSHQGSPIIYSKFNIKTLKLVSVQSFSHM